MASAQFSFMPHSVMNVIDPGRGSVPQNVFQTLLNMSFALFRPAPGRVQADLSCLRVIKTPAFMDGKGVMELSRYSSGVLHLLRGPPGRFFIGCCQHKWFERGRCILRSIPTLRGATLFPSKQKEKSWITTV